MEKKKVINWLIIAGTSILIFLLGVLKEKIPLSLGIIIGLLVGLVNFHLIIRTTLCGLNYPTRAKARRYYFLANLAKYSLIILFIYLIIVSKKVSLLGIVFGLLFSIFFIFMGIY